MSPPRRSNGLPADRFTPLVDLEPHFADALLEALRDEGIAAYASPSPGVRGPYMDVVLPNRPSDRVFVDAVGHRRAHDILEGRRDEFTGDPGPAAMPPGPAEAAGDPAAESPSSSRSPTAEPGDVDAAWRAIIAGYDDTASDPVGRWSTLEDVDPEADDDPAAGPDGPSRGRHGGRRDDDPAAPPGPAEWADPEASGPKEARHRIIRRPDRAEGADDERDAGAAGSPGAGGAPAPQARPPREEAEEHYVPPPPPPLPRLDPHTKLAWIGVVGGPLYLIVSAWTDWVPFDGAAVFALLAFVGGFAALVYRMKDGPDEESNGDDGAVV